MGRVVNGADQLCGDSGHHEHQADGSHFHGFVPTQYQSELMPFIKDMARIH